MNDGKFHYLQLSENISSLRHCLKQWKWLVFHTEFGYENSHFKEITLPQE